ncbi:MAG: DUF1800 family protein [Ilumatobacter sp.]|uniref:DUF1800 family protein n=1 Tax=Ilumatobacter sp. TaxID=1967498 RepID=UPI003299CEFE
MPALNEANVRHLLRRTEFVDRPARVQALLGLGSIEAAVDDIMDVAASPPSVTYDGIPADQGWQRGQRVAEHWVGQMATARRPFGERMAFFWHGHIVSSISKVDSYDAMRAQIDLFRSRGLGTAASSGNVGALMRTASTQAAMLRYLDNDQNFKDSPNQNFARELMELFLLGVGNYTEADVEASTAAWTGHTRTRWDSDTYVFDATRHESAPQRFLGRTINATRPANEAGFETIEVILGTGPLGSGTVPVGPNVSRPSRDVAAEFLTFKLWQEFGEAATGSVPAGVRSAMTSALVSSGFDIRPWVRAMLVHDDFYTGATRTGLVRQPVEYMVALLVATGLDAIGNVPNWLMRHTGQEVLNPPNVSGWRPNGYWVNASAMGARKSLVDTVVWKLTGSTWDGDDGYIQFGPDPSRRLTKTEIEGLWRPGHPYIEPIPTTELVARLVDYTGIVPSAASRQRILAHLDSDVIENWMRLDALTLILSTPEMHIA